MAKARTLCSPRRLWWKPTRNPFTAKASTKNCYLYVRAWRQHSKQNKDPPAQEKMSSSSSWKPWPVDSVLRSLTRNLSLPGNSSSSNNNNNQRWSFLLPRQWPSPSVMASGIGVNIISLPNRHQGRSTTRTQQQQLPQLQQTTGANNNNSRRSPSTSLTGSFDSCVSAGSSYVRHVWPSYERPTHHSSSSSSCSSSSSTSYSKFLLHTSTHQ